MKTLHIHVKVQDLQESIDFYSALFATTPSVQKSDYAKWMLRDPALNFAISDGGSQTGIEHLGFQTDSSEELQKLNKKLQQLTGIKPEENETTCCYAKSLKSWVADPQGIEWELFHTHGTSEVYGDRGKSSLSAETEKS